MAYSMIVVDDEKWIRELVRLSLDWAALGCEISGDFATVEEAIDYARTSPPDIAILDIEMPGISGLGFLDAMVTEFPDTAVVVLSGYSDFEYARHALRRGAIEYLLKPLDEDRLAEVVRAAIGEIEKRQKADQRNRELHAKYNRLRHDRISDQVDRSKDQIPPDEPRVRQVMQQIDSALASPPTLEEAAETVGLTTSYLSQLFSRTVGTRYVDYVRARRIDRAKELLDTTWMRIGEIAELVGYPNANYFARVFREATGLLPSEYRRSDGQ